MIKQKHIYGCTRCGAIFSIGSEKMATNPKGLTCPTCDSPYIDKIEGFKYD